MKIEIDTSKDNEQEIKKIIKMLQAYVGESVSSSYDSKDYEAPSDGMFNIFDNDNSSKDDNDDVPEKDEKEDRPRIQIIDY